MNRLGTFILALCLSGAPSAFALAAPARAPAHRPARPCCLIAAGTPVEVELISPVSTKTQKTGDKFAFRLAAPVIVDGRIALRAGMPGVGEVIEAAQPGLGGKPAKLILAARYLEQGPTHVDLDGMQLSSAGQGHAGEANALGLTGIAFGPLGLIGFAVKGGDASFPRGAKAVAQVSRDVTAPPFGKAAHADIAAARRVARAAAPTDVGKGSIVIPPAPAGQGQVVFFRRKTLLGTGQWFNVREDGKALGKLTNGAYFVQTAAPGLHVYTAKTEPEFNDTLRLQVDPGETYFVQGELTKGLIIGAADLTPSDRAAFDKAAKSLAPAPSLDSEKPEERADSKPAPTAPSDAGPAR
jgi:hypothetical protein